MRTRRLAIGGVLAVSVIAGAGAAVLLGARFGDAAVSATLSTPDERAVGPGRLGSAASVERPVDGAETVRHAHPEPFETSDAATVRAHEQAVRDYIQAAFTFHPDDRRGELHHRATGTLHPDAPMHDTGVLVTSVPPAGAVHVHEPLDVTLTIDTGARTVWQAVTRLVELAPDGTAVPVPGHGSVTSVVIIADWLDEPRVLDHTVDPDPVP